MAIPYICDPMLELRSAFSRESHIGTMHRVERFAVCGLSPLAIGRMNRRQWRQAERWAWIFKLATTDTYTSTGSNTWTCPAGVTSVQAEVWGAGGSPQSPSPTGARGGGGGGAYSLKSGLAVTPSSGYTAFVGAAAAVTAGQDSYFVNSSTCMAKGGATTTGIGGASGGAAASGVGDTKYSGGNGGSSGSAGTTSGGGGGSSAGTGANGNNGSNGGATLGGAGATAPTGGGDGGRGGDKSAAGTNAVNGVQPGGGGGGRGFDATQASAVGGHGKVAITYTDPGHPAMRRFGGVSHAFPRIDGAEGAYIF